MLPMTIDGTPASIVRRASAYSPNITLLDGRKFNLSQQISKSSVNYFILSFLPLLQIVRLGRLNKRFYNLYVPVTLGTVTINGTLPSSSSNQFVFAMRFENSQNMSMLVVPRSQSDSAY